jgi:hypothetical protein
MKLKEVEPSLKSRGIDRRWYSLAGGDVPWAWGGQYCIERNTDGWLVFYRESTIVTKCGPSTRKKRPVITSSLGS